MSNQSLIAALASALGLPKETKKAVLTLENGKAPTIDLTMYVTTASGHYVIEPDGVRPDGTVAQRLARVQFMIRLEPFPD